MKNAGNLIALLAGLGFASGASALDYVEFAKSGLLECIHPTVSLDTARGEMDKEPQTQGDITTARVRIFYKGWINDNSMLVEIKNRKCGSINEVRAEVLEDSGTGKSPVCKYLDGWQDL